MNRAIVIKTTRDTLPLLGAVTAGLILLEMAFVGVFGEFVKEMEFIWTHPLFQRFARMLVGADLGEEATVTALLAFGFAHPLLFAMTWTFILAYGTRVIAGEIERGTADLLLALPVTRGSVYASVSVVWVASGVPLSLAPLAGAWIGESLSPLWQPLDFSRLFILTGNLYALYLCAGAATLFITSLVSRRGPAIAVMLAWLLASFLLNFLSQFWTAAERISVLSIVHYYRSLPVARSGEWPIGDMAILVGVGAALWTAGLWCFSRRDIPAV